MSLEKDSTISLEVFETGTCTFIPLTDPRNKEEIATVLDCLKEMGIYNEDRMAIPPEVEEFTTEKPIGIFAYKTEVAQGIFLTLEETSPLAYLPGGVCEELQDSRYIGAYTDSIGSWFVISNGFFAPKPCPTGEMTMKEANFVKALLLLVKAGKYETTDID